MHPPAAPAADRRGWAAACLFLPALAHVTAIAAGAGVDAAAIHAVAPLCVLPLLPWLWRERTPPVAGLLFLLAWIGWEAATLGVGTVQPSVATARLATDLLAGSAALVLAGARDGLGLLRGLGWGAAATLVFCIVSARLLGSPNIGFGVPNHLLACVVPPLAALVWCEREAPRWRRRLALAAVLLAAAWALWCLPGQPRRGALAALACGVAAPWLWPLAWRRPRLALAIALLALGALVAVLAVIAAAPVGEYRTQRLGMWRAALDGILVWWPTGGGTWAAMRLESLPGDAVRTIAQTGAAIDDPHCLPLAIALEGGLPALLLALGTGWWAVLRLRAAPAEVRAPQLALAGALLPLLLVENAWSLPAPRLLLGAFLGCVLLGSGRPARLPTWPLALLAALAAAWLAWREAPLALLPRHPGTREALAAIGRTCLPQLADAAMQAAEARPGFAPADNYHLAGAGLLRFGPFQPLVRRRYSALSHLIAAAPAPDPRDPFGSAGIRFMNGELGALAVLVLRGDPFEVGACRAIAALDALGERAEGATPAMLAAAALAGRTPPPAGTPMELASIEAMAIARRAALGWPAPGDAERLAEMRRRWPDSPGLRRLAAASDAH